jgi:CRP-like cAMP-binding protein
VDVRRQVVDLLAGFALFADLKAPELEGIVDMFDEAWFSENERILRQGFSGSGFYVILEGTASIRVDGVDRATLGAGDYFGEISCLLGDLPVADIVAQSRLRCLVLPGGDLEGFLVAHPRVMFRLLQGEARKVRATTQWLS